MSAKTSVTKPKIPEDVLQIDKWLDMDLAPYISALGYDHVNGFPDSRTEAMAVGDDDTAAYKAIAKFHANGGGTDATKLLHKNFLDDTKAGPYLADIIRGTIHADVLDHADDKNRLTALKTRLRDSIPTP